MFSVDDPAVPHFFVILRDKSLIKFECGPFSKDSNELEGFGELQPNSRQYVIMSPHHHFRSHKANGRTSDCKVFPEKRAMVPTEAISACVSKMAAARKEKL